MYRGRFAPSPTGKLHIGSLYTAMASYCDAMKSNGDWTLRIEDLDPPREIKGASQSIIHSLSALGFEFNSKILYQSQQDRQTAYQKALQQLMLVANIYYCTCSRTKPNIDSNNQHKCLKQKLMPNRAFSTNIHVPNQTIEFEDKIQGSYQRKLFDDCGDFVVKRKDGLFSYQLAVVVDDHFQNINHIVRGIDLISSTPWQIYLINLLNFHIPSYSHLPILVNPENQKLSKQTFAQEVDASRPIETLIIAYKLLAQKPFPDKPNSLLEFWNHAIKHWDINKIPKLESIKV
jgi:glutamyl-Q tRNA(Asp) synthetase